MKRVPTEGKVKVLRIIARLNVGGPALHATLLTERLDPARYDCRLVAGQEDSGEGSYLDLHQHSITRLTRIPALGRPIRGYRDVLALIQLIRIMREFKPDIVHTHTAKAGTLGRIAARLTGVPIVIHTYHGHVFHGYFSSLWTRVLVHIERLLARLSDRLLTVSPAVRTDLLRLGIGTPDQLSVLPLGLDLEKFRQSDRLRGELRRELGLPADTLLVGIVARLVPIKGHEVFLQAASDIVRQNPRVYFLIVGDGQRRRELVRLVCQLGLANRVRFLGWRGDLDRVYADLDVVMLTSHNEGSPVSLIEAMTAGCAVVSTRVGGVPDLLEDGTNGVLVPPGAPAATASAVTELLRDTVLRRSLGRAASTKVYPAYSASRLVDDIDHLYRSLLAGNVART